MDNELPIPERALVISAHPDDPEFGAAGTVALWTQAGAEVTYVIVSDGSKGSADPQMTSQQLAAIRKREQQAAADVLGVKQVLFLDYPDGGIYNTPELRRDIVEQIRRYRPEVLVTHDPTSYIVDNTYINHPDHRAVGSTTLDAVFPLARDRLNFPEHLAQGLEPYSVLDIFLVFTNEPNFWVDISSTVDKKVAALREHCSQFSEPEKVEEWVRERSRQWAQDKPYEYAERFRRVKLAR